MASLRGRNEEADTVKLGNSSFVSNVMGQVGSALPPDVRRRLCPAVDVPFRPWACPFAAFGPIDSKG